MSARAPSRRPPALTPELLLLAALVPFAAAAQLVSDPTRPPAGMGEGPGEATSAASAGPTLQSVVISPAGKAAIISGVMVKLGGRYGDARLVQVSESEVVLRKGNATQVLKLHPGVEKKMVGPAAGAKRAGDPSSR